MAQFPLALSIEPRLLPPAVANGFRMDDKVRIYSDFRLFSIIGLTMRKVSRLYLSQDV